MEEWRGGVCHRVRRQSVAHLATGIRTVRVSQMRRVLFCGARIIGLRVKVTLAVAAIKAGVVAIVVVMRVMSGCRSAETDSTQHITAGSYREMSTGMSTY